MRLSAQWRARQSGRRPLSKSVSLKNRPQASRGDKARNAIRVFRQPPYFGRRPALSFNANNPFLRGPFTVSGRSHSVVTGTNVPAYGVLRVLDKRLDLDGFVASLRDGMTIGIGGWATRRKPMALVRAIARSDLKDLTIVCYGGPDVGTLVAAGKVKKLIFGFVSLDHFPLDPHFRA